MNNAFEIFNSIQNWFHAGKKAALATVVSKQGTALMDVGSKMAVSEEIEIIGSVSGGCVESEVAQVALDCMENGRIETLDFGISDEDAWSVGLACGGQIRVLVQPVGILPAGITQKLIRNMASKIKGQNPFFLITQLSGAGSGETTVLDTPSLTEKSVLIKNLDGALKEELVSLLHQERSALVHSVDDEYFADLFFPAPRMIMIGAVHIAQTLVPMANMLGFRTIVIDPRKAFATCTRFPDADQLITVWPDEGLRQVGLNERDYLLVLSHDDKLDLPAVISGLRANVKYLGMLSSHTNRDVRYEKLKQAGIDPGEFDQIHAPIGLDIGSRSPAEISLSILAEIVAVRYNKPNRR